MSISSVSHSCNTWLQKVPSLPIFECANPLKGRCNMHWGETILGAAAIFSVGCAVKALFLTAYVTGGAFFAAGAALSFAAYEVFSLHRGQTEAPNQASLTAQRTDESVVTQLRTDLATAQNERQQATQTIAQLQQRTNDLQIENSNLIRTTQGLNQTVQNHQSLQARYQELDTQHQQMQREFEALQLASQQLKASFDQAENTQDADLTQVGTWILEGQKTAQAFEQESKKIADALQDALKRFGLTMETRKQQREVVNAEVAQARSNADQEKQQIETQVAILNANFTKEKQDKEKEMTTIRETHQALTAQYNSLQAKSQEYDSMKITMEKHLSKMRVENERKIAEFLKAEDECKKISDAKGDELNRLNQAIAQKKLELAQLTGHS